MARKKTPGFLENLDEGAFTQYMRRRFGKAAFNRDGTLKLSYINKVINDPRTSLKRKRQAVLAKNFKTKFKRRGK